ncbi:MAG: twin-arginine translocase TatA/TatE family subunit [Chloroflexi bacterium]|nr:twin-arginine translocase TatA/TatE family subunit [Chloroflexota bacterium]
MPHLGPWELGIILVIVIAVFGAGKLAGLGGALGKGVRDFRSAVKEGSKEETEDEPTEANASVEAEKEE